MAALSLLGDSVGLGVRVGIILFMDPEASMYEPKL
jgi:hypothetical protein